MNTTDKLNAKVLAHHTLPISYFELPDDQCKYFNYLDENEKYDMRLLPYRCGDSTEYIDINDTLLAPDYFGGWLHGWASTSFFDGIGIVWHGMNGDNDECDDDDCYSVIHAWF